VEDLLKDFVREDWVKKLDFTTLEKMNGSYVTDDLRTGPTTSSGACAGPAVALRLLLLEFQSTVDPWMAVRIMTYVGLLYQDLIKTGQVNRRSKMLPPVLPVVLYNGKPKWTAATDISH